MLLTKLKLAMAALLITFLVSHSGAAYAIIRPDAPSVALEIIETDAGVRVRYITSEPMTSIPFAEHTSANPNAIIESVGAPVSAGTQGILASEPQSVFEIAISPDVEVARSTYPVLSDLGEAGYLIYAPRLLPSLEIDGLTYTNLDGEVLQIAVDAAIEGYVYLGTEIEQDIAYDAVFSSEVPEVLRSIIRLKASDYLNYYSEQMNSEPTNRPLIVIDFQVAEQELNRGDVTPNHTIFIRVRSPSNETAFEPNTRQIHAFLAHEIFHLWTTQETDDPGGWWIHEGAAEVAAWLAVGASNDDASYIVAQAERALNACIAQLRTQSMSDAISIGRSSVRYSCGSIINWLAIVNADHFSIEQAAFGIWVQIWPNQIDQFSHDEFRENSLRLLVRDNPLSELVYNTSGTGRWIELSALITASDRSVSVIENPPTEFSAQVSAAQAIGRSVCGQVWGVGVNNDELFVQLPPACEGFPDSIIITSANTVSPIENPNDFLLTVLNACERNDRLIVGMRIDGDEVNQALACTSEVEMPPPVFSLQLDGSENENAD